MELSSKKLGLTLKFLRNEKKNSHFVLVLWVDVLVITIFLGTT